MNHQHILFWGGLRGALALALARSSDRLPKRDAIISVDFIAVAFSVIVQGLTMTPLLRYLGELATAHDSEKPAMKLRLIKLRDSLADSFWFLPALLALLNKLKDKNHNSSGCYGPT